MFSSDTRTPQPAVNPLNCQVRVLCGCTRSCSSVGVHMASETLDGGGTETDKHREGKQENGKQRGGRRKTDKQRAET